MSTLLPLAGWSRGREIARAGALEVDIGHTTSVEGQGGVRTRNVGTIRYVFSRTPVRRGCSDVHAVPIAQHSREQIKSYLDGRPRLAHERLPIVTRLDMDFRSLLFGLGRVTGAAAIGGTLENAIGNNMARTVIMPAEGQGLGTYAVLLDTTMWESPAEMYVLLCACAFAGVDVVYLADFVATVNVAQPTVADAAVYATRLIARILNMALELGVGAEHYMAVMCGQASYITLHSHSTEGGAARIFADPVYPVATGAITNTSVTSVMGMSPVYNCVVSYVEQLALEGVLRLARLIAVSDPGSTPWLSADCHTPAFFTRTPGSPAIPSSYPAYAEAVRFVERTGMTKLANVMGTVVSYAIMPSYERALASVVPDRHLANNGYFLCWVFTAPLAELMGSAAAVYADPIAGSSMPLIRGSHYADEVGYNVSHSQPDLGCASQFLLTSCTLAHSAIAYVGNLRYNVNNGLSSALWVTDAVAGVGEVPALCNNVTVVSDTLWNTPHCAAPHPGATVITRYALMRVVYGMDSWWPTADRMCSTQVTFGRGAVSYHVAQPVAPTAEWVIPARLSGVLRNRVSVGALIMPAGWRYVKKPVMVAAVRDPNVAVGGVVGVQPHDMGGGGGAGIPEPPGPDDLRGGGAGVRPAAAGPRVRPPDDAGAREFNAQHEQARGGGQGAHNLPEMDVGQQQPPDNPGGDRLRAAREAVVADEIAALAAMGLEVRRGPARAAPGAPAIPVPYVMPEALDRRAERWAPHADAVRAEQNAERAEAGAVAAEARMRGAEAQLVRAERPREQAILRVALDAAVDAADVAAARAHVANPRRMDARPQPLDRRPPGGVVQQVVVEPVPVHNQQGQHDVGVVPVQIVENQPPQQGGADQGVDEDAGIAHPGEVGE